MRWLVRGVAVGGFAVCLAGFASRTHPDLFPIAPTIDDSRLSFPLTYWNGLGFLAALSLILATSIASDRQGGFPGRILAAAATPILAATLILTLGRGPVAAAIAGLSVLVVLGFGPGMVSGLLAVAPASAVAIHAALGADLLTTHDATTDAAIVQGHHLAVVVGLAAAGAAAIMILLRPVDRRLPSRLDRRLFWGGVTVAAIAAIAGAWVAGVPRFVERGFHDFTNPPNLPVAENQRDRLTRFGSQARLDHWEVALQGFEQHPVGGSGAGTFQNVWEEHRQTRTHVREAHSLYLETLAELGVVGLALLLTVLGTILYGFLRRARGPNRTLYAGLTAAFVAWALEAGIDWIWELPAVTAWLFFAGGAALAGAPRSAAWVWGRGSRLLAAASVLLLCVLPVRIALSQAQLDNSIDAFASNDCGSAIDSSLASLAAFGDRPEPLALMGYCDVRLGQPRLALGIMRRAVALDPHRWEYHYGYALTRAAAGLDPGREARRARALNPLEPSTVAAVRAFRGRDARSWSRVAARLPLPPIWGQPLGGATPVGLPDAQEELSQ